MEQTPLTVRRWSRFEYEKLVDTGFFEGDHVELIAGQLIVAEPQGSYHATVVSIVCDSLRRLLPAGWVVREEKPIALDDESAPEPDIVVVPGVHEDYLNAHPGVPSLAIEVADSSLRFDRRLKASAYARGRIADYWIVNVTERQLEVYRDPVPDANEALGHRYASRTDLKAGASVSPLARPAASVAVSELLP